MGAIAKTGGRRGIGAPSPQRASQHQTSRAPDPATLEAEIAGLDHLDLDGLRARWLKLRGFAPPAALRRDMLMRALAYEMQVAVHGGLPSAVKRRLRQLADAAREDRFEEVLGVAHMKPGTLLLRVFQGQTHKVTVAEDGYIWKGNTYGSLSTIAKRITGTSWNGWTFVGMKKPTGRNQRAAKGAVGSATSPAAGKPIPVTSRVSAKAAPRKAEGVNRHRTGKELTHA